MLASRYSTQTITVLNYGKGGEKAVDSVGRGGAAFNAERPDGALILDGYNDLSTQGDAGIDSAIAAINEVVKEARFRGARVFLGTLTPPFTNVNKGISRGTIDRFNARLRDMARGENAVLVDVNSYFTDPNRFNSDDGRHPNEAGYRQIAQAFYDAIQREFEVR
jgi:lysophospholipase L1-like esterase